MSDHTHIEWDWPAHKLSKREGVCLMQMMQARCADCEWVFDVVTSPAPITVWAKTAQRRACCPMCGNDNKARITLANPRPLTEQEANHKRKLMPTHHLRERETTNI